MAEKQHELPLVYREQPEIPSAEVAALSASQVKRLVAALVPLDKLGSEPSSILEAYEVLEKRYESNNRS